MAQTAAGATSVSPASVIAGTGALSVTLGGNFPLAGRGVYSFCVVSGGTASKIAPTSITTTSAVVPLPATTVQVAPSYFTSGVALVQISLASRASICTYPASSSNVAMQILYPTITSASLLALQQNNLTPGPASVPNRVEVLGTNFIAGNTYATVSIDSSYTSGHLTADVITSGSLTFARPAVKDLGLSNLTIHVCNLGGNYSYCSLSSNPVIPLYSPAKTTVTASATPVSVLPGGSSTLSAKIATAGPTQTSGGNFVPGAPSGSVVFKDTTAGTTLGTVKVTPSTLAFTTANAQPLTITTGGFHPDGSPSLLIPLVADFNQDGIPDTLIIQNTEATMQLFLGGSPAGTLQAAQAITVAQYCYSLPAATVGDFNGDGYPDIAYLCGDSSGGSQIYMALNNGDGTFPAYYGYYVGDAGAATQLVAADFNNDKILDLVATGQTNSPYDTPVYGIETFFGTGGSQPNFNAGPVTTTTDVPGTQLVAADFNNDKYTDLALLHTNANGVVTIQPYQNNGKAVFTTAAAIPVSAATTRLIARPFTTNTAYSDLAAVEPGVGVVVALNKRTKTTSFSTPVPTALPKLTDGIFADFDGDSISDLAYYDSSAVHVLSGRGDGGFSNVFGQTLTQANLVLQAAADLNADGHADLVVYEHNGLDSEFVFHNIVSVVTTGTSKATLPAAFSAGGAHNITATYSGNIDLTSGSGTTGVSVTQLTQAITWNPPATATTTTLINAAYLNATASIAGTFAYTPISGSYLSAGSQTLTAVFTPADTVDYASVTTTRTVTVTKSAVSTFVIAATPANQTYNSGVPTVVSITLNGTHYPPGGAVQFYDGSVMIGTADLIRGTAASSVASLTLASISTGNHAFGASYGGDSIYSQLVVPVSRYIVYTVGKVAPIITWTPNPQTISYGTKLSAAQLDAVAKNASGTIIPGTFTYTPGAGAILDAGEHSISVTFTPTDTTDYTSATDRASVIVSTFTPVITWTAPTAITYGTPLSAIQLDAVARDINGATVPGSFAYSPAAGSFLNVGTTQDTATFTPSNNQDFNTATKTVPIVVNAANSSTVLQLTPNPTTYGEPVTLKATVSDTSGKPLSGTVTFADQTTGTSLGQATLTAGSASITYSLPSTGEHEIVVTYPGDTMHLASTGGPIALTVNKASPTIAWKPAVATIVYGTALSSSQLNATASFSGPASLPNLPGTFTYTPAIGTVLAAGSHTLNVSFVPNDTTNFKPTSGSTVITVTKATPTITWPAISPIGQGTALSATQLDATATGVGGTNLPGAFTYNPSSGTVLAAGLQTLNVSFVPTDTTDYSTTAASNTIHVLATTTTTVTGTPNPAYASESVTLTATIAHAGAAAAAGSATFFDGSLRLATVPVVNNTSAFTTSALSVATHSIHVLYSGDTNYQTSTSASITEAIVPDQISVTWNPTPATIPYGTPLGAGQLDATGFDPPGNPLSGTLTYTPALGTVLSAGTQTLSVLFTPASPFVPVTKTTTITVTKIAPTIAWPTPAAINQGTPLSATQLDATVTGLNNQPVSGSFGYNPAAGTILQPGLQSLHLTFVPDTGNYLAATASRTIQVNNALTTTTLISTPNPSTFGQTVTLTATVVQTGTETAALTGTVTFRDTTTNTQLGVAIVTAGKASLTISTLTSGSHAITATYSGDINYNGSTTLAATTQVVGTMTPVITWAPTTTTIPYGTALGTAQLNAIAKTASGVTVPGVFTYTPAPGTVLNAGSQTLSLSFVPADTTNFKNTTAETVITVTRLTPTITWPAPAAINQGTALSATQLDATATGLNSASLSGVFTYAPPAGTILQPGIQTLSLSFVPTDSVDYTTAASSRTIQVNNALTTTTLSSTPNPSSFGQTVTFAATVAQAGTETTPITGTVTFRDTTTDTQLGVATVTAGKASLTISTLTSGSHSIAATYSGDTNYVGSVTTTPVIQSVGTRTPAITWNPNPSTIPYGTPLSPGQLDAIAFIPNTTTPVSGTFTYSPTLGTVLGIGTQTLTVTFVPSDPTSFDTATAAVPLVVQSRSTSTLLAITSSGAPVATVTSGSVVTLTATVASGTDQVAPGQVKFCDANAATCADSHLLGTAQLTSAGTATLKFIPGIGVYNYKAIFLGTKNSTGSTSTTHPFAVTGLYPTQTTISEAGTPDDYTLTGTVVGTGGATSIPLTGTVSFPSSDTGIPSLGTAPLGTSVAGITFNALTSTVSVDTPLARSAIGDFNGDGIPDVANANTASANTATTVTIALGNGDGTFTMTATSPATGSRPVGIIAADFNSDGKLDLATANQAGGTVTILLGNGDGTFTPAPTVTVRALPDDIVSADFNGDGIPDLAVSVSGGISVLLGKGDGTFTTLFTTVSPNLARLVTADFNGDGKPDLAVMGYSDSSNLFVLLGNGDGTFITSATMPQAVGSTVDALTTGDFNQDGKVDLARTTSATQSITILTGAGDGTFTSATVAAATYARPTEVQTADFNGDGKLDLAIVNIAGGTVPKETVLLGNGDGTFTTPPISTGSDSTGSLAIADANGDGVPDLVSDIGSTTITSALTQRTQTASASITNVHVIGANTTTQVSASYLGDTHFASSTSKSVPLTGETLIPTITWVPNPATIVYGTALSAAQLDANAFIPNTTTSLAGAFTYTPAAGTILTAGTQTLSATFIPADAVTYQPVTTSKVITITRATPNITWPPIAAITQGAALSAAQLNATVTGLNNATLPGNFSYTPPAGTILQSGTQPLSLLFTPTDLADYTTGIATNSVVVNKAATSTTVASSLNPAPFGQSVTLTATVGRTIASTAAFTGSVAFTEGTTPLGTAQLSSGSASVTLSSLSAGTHLITASYSGDINDLASQGQVTQAVTASGSIVSWAPTVTTFSYGTALGSSELNAVAKTAAGASIPGTFAYTPVAGTILDAGSQVLNVTFTPTDTTNFKTATAQTVITVTKGTPSIAWPAPAVIPQGTALSATQLNAAATYSSVAVPGTYTYTPAAGTIPNAGVQTITLLFTPNNLTDFNPVTTTNSVSVTQSSTTTTLTSSLNPSSASKPITITANVARANSSTSPLTGSVTFTEGSRTLATVPIATGTAALSTSNLTVGSHSITATYSGDINDLSSQGHLTQVVDIITPVITWTPNVSTISYGTALGADQLNALAKDAEGVEVHGTYTYTPPSGTFLAVGPHTLTVLFTPTDTATYTTATASTTITVQQATASTTLAITSGGIPATTIATGDAATLTATVSAGTTPITTGQVNFCDATVAYCTDIHLFGTAQLTSAGTASVKLSPGIGSHSYKAVYLPTTHYTSSASAAVPLTVSGRYATSTTLAATGDVGNYTLTATTTGFANPAAAPTGAITFIDTTNSNATLGTANLGDAARSVSFGVSESPTTGTGYQFTATADFNGDGKLDLAVINRYNNTVTIMLGKGDGTFTVGSVASTGGMPQLIGIGDFNGDGIIDLAVTNFDDNTVSVFVGKGDGTFTVASTPSIGPSGSPVGIAIGDFNGDGKADIAVPTQGSETVKILLGNGDGTFALSSSAASVGKTPFVVVTGDLNNDGRPDLAVANFNSNTVTILLGNGDGTFKASTPIATGNNPLALSLGDFNADGKLDLAIPNFGDGTISVLLGKGDGTFGPASTIAVGKSPYSVAVGDFNGDGKLDIAVPNAGDNTVSVLIGHGDGSFTPGSLATVGGYPSYISVGDLNGDGDTDLAIANQANGPAVSILLAQLTQTVTAAATGISPLRIGTPQHAVVAAYPGDTGFKPSTSTPVTLAETALVTPIIHWNPAVTSIPYGTALGSQQLNASIVDATGATISGAVAYTPSAGAILNPGKQTLSLTFVPTDTQHFASATATTVITVTKDITTTAITSGVNPTTFGQSTTLTATVARTTSTAPGATPLTGSVTFTDGSTPIGTVALASGVASLPIATLAVGSHTITAAYSGDANDLVSSRQLTVVVNTIATRITWSPVPSTIVYGTALTAGQFDATATNNAGAPVAGNFTYSAKPGDILNAGAQTLTASFIPTDAVHDASAQSTTVINVTRATPTITWPTPAAIDQGTALGGNQLNATIKGVTGATLAGNVTYTPAAGSTLSAGVHTLSVTFVPADTVNYTNATATVSLTVLNAMTQTVLTSSVNPAQFGQTTILTASITRLGTITNPLTGTVTFYDGATQLGTPVQVVLPNVANGPSFATLPIATLGAGTHKLTATYSGDSNYITSTSVQLAQTITVAPTTVTWTPTVSTIPYGTGLAAAQLNPVASSPYVPSVSGLFTYTPAAGTMLNAGTQTLKATFAPTDSTDFAASAGSATITVTQATPKITWTAPAPIAQGTALSATQLNAAITGITGATLAGTVSYTPAAGAILPAGTTTLSVLFTPTDTVNYTTATATVPLIVNIPTTNLVLTANPNPAQAGQPVTLTATLSETGTSTQPISGTITFYDSGKAIGTSPIASNAAVLIIPTLTVGNHSFAATYAGSAGYATSTSNTLVEAVSAATTTIHWTPAPASIVYGTALSVAQLDATASTTNTTSVPGSFTYTPAAGAVLTAGTKILSVTFTPTDTTNFTAASQTASLTVTRATPTVTFPTPPYTVVGSTLGAAQLNASATGVTGATLPGSFTYSPAAGAIVAAGPQVLTVTFTPADTANYTTAQATTTLNGTAVTLTSLDSTKASLGDRAKTITLTGTGFVSDSVARSNGAALATTYVSATTLQAVIPASSLLTVQTLQISVFDPSQNQTTASIPFIVVAPSVNATVSAPPTASPGDQPSITLNLATPYAVPVTAKFSLAFTPVSGGIVDPNIQFAGGGQTTSFDVAAGQTTAPAIQIQSGTVAGVINITLTLTAGGVDVTPAGATATVISVPAVVPGLSQVAIAGSGRQLTVTTFGYSNTREITQAHFHFTPAAGKQIQTQDITLDVSSIFSGWFTSPDSDTYGSEFLYTQTFSLDDDASIVGQVTVTLSNSIGVSAAGASQ
ncbi:EF hand domain/PKD domain protein [Granulicella sibirica]|uniref:EF hand domain/PKD domain protein n=2 Tax=Granulicella sibirica TaxID=2479048 RepID=A0A4Q0T333_9BACT|nr:EF hand domain/PKD domain protein [Granulicella sibirica]